MFVFEGLWSFVPFIILAHLGGATVWVFSTVRLQQTVPEDILGRIFAFEYAAWTLMFVSSTGLYSILMDHVGIAPQTVLTIMGATLLLPSLGWWLRIRCLSRTCLQSTRRMASISFFYSNQNELLLYCYN